MVECFPDYCRLDLKECDLIQQNLVWVGSSRDRAVFVRAVHDGVRGQVNRSIRSIAAGGEFARPSYVDLEYGIADVAINSLRTILTADQSVSSLHGEEVNELVSAYDQKRDELRRQQIISPR